MQTLRTPDERFADLPDSPFPPHYVEVSDQEGGTLRVHYLDEGRADGSIVLCMHGEPSWSYLYRKMIPLLVAAGHRVIAPDLVGFGKSDKPLITCFSDRDPVTAGGDAAFRKLVPGAQGQPHVTVADAHHFFQEDAAPQLAQIVIDAIAASKQSS